MYRNVLVAIDGSETVPVMLLKQTERDLDRAREARTA